MATQTNITAPDYTESTLYNRGYQDVSFSLFKHPMSRDFGKKSDAASRCCFFRANEIRTKGKYFRN